MYLSAATTAAAARRRDHSGRDDHVKIAVLAGSVAAAVLATAVLRVRDRAYRRLRAAEEADRDGDRIPDVCQR